jgi:hypothetical protein
LENEELTEAEIPSGQISLPSQLTVSQSPISRA